MKIPKWLRDLFTPTTPEQHEQNGYNYAYDKFGEAKGLKERQKVLEELQARSYGSEDGFDKGIRRFLSFSQRN